MLILFMRLEVLSTMEPVLFLCLGNESGVKAEPVLDDAACDLFIHVSQSQLATFLVFLTQESHPSLQSHLRNQQFDL
jgi:hypothetical protein